MANWNIPGRRVARYLEVVLLTMLCSAVALFIYGLPFHFDLAAGRGYFPSAQAGAPRIPRSAGSRSG